MKHELQVYLDNWLRTVEVCDFDLLKELILTEQFKKRVPAEIMEYYIDVWEDIKDASVLAEKCDRFEAMRKDYRKFEPKKSICCLPDDFFSKLKKFFVKHEKLLNLA